MKLNLDLEYVIWGYTVSMRVSDVYNLMYDMQVALLMLIHANNKHGLVKKLSQCGISSNITQKHYSR